MTGRGRLAASTRTIALCAVLFMFPCSGTPAQEAAGDAAVLDDLVAAVGGDDRARATDATLQLVDLGPAAADAAPALVPLLGHAQSWTRSGAYESLCAIGEPAVAPLLDALAGLPPDHADARRRAWTAGALWELADVALPALTARLDGDDAAQRVAAVRALCHVVPAPEAATRLAALLQDENQEVRAAAIASVTVSPVGSVDAVRALLAILRAKDDPLRGAAAGALRAVIFDAALAKPDRRKASGAAGKAIHAAEQWLLAHQGTASDRRWSGGGFRARCPQGDACGNPGEKLYDQGLSGLAVLALLPSVETPRLRDGDPVSRAVRTALLDMSAEQDGSGVLATAAGFQWIYNHAIASLAFVEAFARHGNPLDRHIAVEAVRFGVAAQNPGLGWRYGIRDKDNDSSITGWMCAYLRLAELYGIEVPTESLTGAQSWFDAMTDPETGRVGYMRAGGRPARTIDNQEAFPALYSESHTAIATNCRILLGVRPDEHPGLRQGIALCAASPPRWAPEIGAVDMYYWLAGTHALARAGGPAWSKWQSAIVKATIAGQEDGRDHDAGSWGPIGPWGNEGGRLYSTAAMLGCLQVAAGRAVTTERQKLDTLMKRALKEMSKRAKSDKDPHVKRAAEGLLRDLERLRPAK